MLDRARAALEIVSTATVIAAAAMLLWTLVADQSTAASGARTRIESVDGRIEAADIRNRKGAAEVAIVEFADYECPFCRTHAQDVFPESSARIDSAWSGRVRIRQFSAGHHPPFGEKGE
jgi:Zn finger protein HypA/HybF involved in hydrogenase expression